MNLKDYKNKVELSLDNFWVNVHHLFDDEAQVEFDYLLKELGFFSEVQE